MAISRYNVRAYRGTGFDFINLPDTPALIDSLPAYKDYSDCVLLQNMYLPSLRISTTWEDIREVDYIRLRPQIQPTSTLDAYYVVVGINMINENVAEIIMSMDAINTAGGIYNIQLSGWAKRKHVTDDGLFKNVIPEPFQPSTALEIDGSAYINVGSGEPYKIVASTIDLEDYQPVAVEYAYESRSVVVPQIPTPIKQGTTVGIYGPVVEGESTLIGKSELPNTALYNLDSIDDVTLSAIRSLGLEGVLSASYTLPRGITNVPAGKVSSLFSQFHVSTASNIPYKYGASARFNNKVFYGEFNRYNLTSLCSGESMEFKAQEIYNESSSGAPQFGCFVDPAPKGKPYARPVSFMGNVSDVFMGCVSGEEWQSSPIVYSGASGSAIAMNSINAGKRITERSLNIMAENYATGVMNSFINFVSSAASAGMSGSPAGLMNTVSNFASAEYNMVRGSQMLEMQQSQMVDEYNQRFTQQMASINLTVPDVMFPRSQSLQNYIGNNFYVYRTRLSDNDATRFDTFLNMYGYAVDEPLTTLDMHSRLNYNYLVGKDVQVILLNYAGSITLREAIKAQLERGVRIWHKQPSVSYYTQANPVNASA